jgi:hypothetical protein
MKGISKLFHVVALATIIALLMVAIPATPALALSVTLDPTTGKIGDTVDITGSGFPATQDVYGAPTYYVNVYFSSDYLSTSYDITDLDSYELVVDGTQTDATGHIDDSFDVPVRLRDGSVDADVKGGTYYVYTTRYSETSEEGPLLTRSNFTVISSELTLTPVKGPVGKEVEISGTDFGDRETLTVEYDEDEIDIESGDTKTDSSGEFTCTIIIPESTAGAHTITVTDESDNTATAEFTVEPTMTMSPTGGAVGDTVTISGTGFGEELDVTIKFGGTEVVTDVTDDVGNFATTFNVPVKSPGAYTVEAKDEDSNKKTASFTIAASMKLSQATGNVGSQVTISGTGFKPNTTVTITYATEPVVVATPPTDANGAFSVTFPVPQSTAGKHTITATDGTSTLTTTFTMESTAPAPPQPLLPQMGVKQKQPVIFDWEDVTDPSLPVTYTLQIATDEDFSTDVIVLEKEDLTNSDYTITKEEEKLKPRKKETPYYWRVKAIDGASNESQWSTPGSFYVSSRFVMPRGAIYALIAIGVGFLAFWLGRRTAYRRGSRGNYSSGSRDEL